MNRRLLAAALAVVAGCAAPERPARPHDLASSWTNPRDERRPLRRVLVPPFEDRTGFPVEAERLRRTFVEALSRRGDYDLVAVDGAELRDEAPAAVFHAGAVSRKSLVAAARRYRADGVLFGVVRTLRPYEPLALGISIELVASDDGATTWSVDANYDASQREVEEDARNYHETRLATTKSLEGWRLILISPSRFAEYACARIAAKAP